MIRTLPPPAPPAPPTQTRRPVLPYAVLGWALTYGALRLCWAVAGAPAFSPLDTDLMVFTGWWAVGLCAATALLGAALGRARTWHPALVAAGWAVCAAPSTTTGAPAAPAGRAGGDSGLPGQFVRRAGSGAS